MHGAAGRCERDKRCERGGTRRNTVASGGRAGKQQTGARMKPSYAHRRSGVHLISTATRQLPRQPVDADHSCLIRKTTPLPIPRHGAGGMHLTLLAEIVTAVESTGARVWTSVRRRRQSPADARHSVMRAVSRRDHSIGVPRNGIRHEARMHSQPGVDRKDVVTGEAAQRLMPTFDRAVTTGTLVVARCPDRKFDLPIVVL